MYQLAFSRTPPGPVCLCTSMYLSIYYEGLFWQILPSCHVHTQEEEDADGMEARATVSILVKGKKTFLILSLFLVMSFKANITYTVPYYTLHNA